MKYQVAKDKAKRALVQRQEMRRLKHRFIIRNTKFPMSYRWHHCIKLSRLSRNGSKVRVKNRCILTGRAKSVHRQFKISRIALRELASMGLINGVMKSSW
jgi:small subunit ribosomal protein S14